MVAVRGKTPGVGLMAAATMAVLVVAASAVPARRASRIDPASALRAE